MSCTVLGPGLLGCFLGAAAGTEALCCGPSGRQRAERVQLPDGRRLRWTPRRCERPGAGPLLVACRAPDTPAALPRHALLAQNGLGQDHPTIACFLALDLLDGELRSTGPRPRLVLDPPPSPWRPVLAAWRAAGITVEIGDGYAARFEKAVLNASVGPLCLATGLGMRAVWADAQLRALCRAVSREGETIARDAGIALAPGLGERADAFFAAVDDHRPSVLDDPRELDWVLGPLRELARRHGTPCPALEEIARRCAPRAVSSG